MQDFLRENGYFDFGNIKDRTFNYKDSCFPFFGKSDAEKDKYPVAMKWKVEENSTYREWFSIIDSNINNSPTDFSYSTMLVNGELRNVLKKVTPKEYLSDIFNNEIDQRLGWNEALRRLFFQVFELYQSIEYDNFDEMIKKYSQIYHDYIDFKSYYKSIIESAGEGYNSVFKRDEEEIKAEKEKLENEFLINLESFVNNCYFVKEKSLIDDLSLINGVKCYKFIRPAKPFGTKENDVRNIFDAYYFLPIIEKKLMKLI